ncbi:phytochelatin synthase family protein [Pseudoxanthomonas sp. UTMC 1351]|uniref:phytochelatin synthase family protein n=1 Tax=Pseudoxanthomonas sp. UTMC 1351 TaxID=2695853 RepID=UPI0034CD2AC1
MNRGRAGAALTTEFTPGSDTRQRGSVVTKKRVLSIAGVAMLGLFILASLLVWNRFFRSPSVDLLPLPDNLIALESSVGKKFLAESEFVADYQELMASFVAQSRPAYCGVATSVIALNALRSPGPPLDQSTFFNVTARQVKDPLRVSLTGMSLRQLGDLLRAHGADASVVYASDTDIDSFRSVAQRNLMTDGDFLLVNYQRAELGQVEMGHISPLAAYHAGADRFLILDVAAYKYPSVWVSTKELWNAMGAPVGSSPRTRGFIVVREGALTRSASLSVSESVSVRNDDVEMKEIPPGLPDPPSIESRRIDSSFTPSRSQRAEQDQVG